MARLVPAVVPAARVREDERAYLQPMHSKKLKTRVARDRIFSLNCSIPPRKDSKVKITSVSLCAADLNASVSMRPRPAVQRASILNLIGCQKMAKRRHRPHSR